MYWMHSAPKVWIIDCRVEMDLQNAELIRDGEFSMKPRMWSDAKT